jgi:hypothetical protein
MYYKIIYRVALARLNNVIIFQRSDVSANCQASWLLIDISCETLQVNNTESAVFVGLIIRRLIHSTNHYSSIV